MRDYDGCDDPRFLSSSVVLNSGFRVSHMAAVKSASNQAQGPEILISPSAMWPKHQHFLKTSYSSVQSGPISTSSSRSWHITFLFGLTVLVCLKKEKKSYLLKALTAGIKIRAYSR